MKTKLWPAAALAALLIASNTFPLYAANADTLPEIPDPSQNSNLISDSTPTEEWGAVSSGDIFPSSDNPQTQEPSAAETEISDPAVPDRLPAFSAHIEYFHGQGYVVKGNFTEFLPSTILVRPLYSLEGKVWQSCPTTWSLQCLNSETAGELKQLQNQICLYGTHEPLAGYLAGQLNRFFMKLQITLEDGITYETQTAVIDRGDPQPLPEEFNPVAVFVPAMLVRQWRPFQQYGQYQLTVSADATPENVAALLPDTLPMDIQLYAGIDFVANAIVDCPVTWKALSLSRLTPGERAVIADAAEEIIVPAGTLLNTPIGTFQLEEPLGIDHNEVRLILNVVAEDADPSGNTCELPDRQPDLNGSGGNECNAGSDNKNDSTSEGQRPGLPQDPEDGADTQTSQLPETPQIPEDETDIQTPQLPETPQIPETETDTQTPQLPETPQIPEDGADTQTSQLPETPQIPEAETDTQTPQLPETPQVPEAGADTQTPQLPETPQIPEAETDTQTSQLPETQQVPETPQNPTDKQDPSETDTMHPVPPLSEAKPEGQPDASRKMEDIERSGHTLRRLFLPVAAAAIGICIPIAAGKASAGSVSGRIYRKMMHSLYRLLRLK